MCDLWCRYVKGADPGNWLTIDPKTGDIRLNKMPDRESQYLVNGTYYAKVLSISEGTLFISLSVFQRKITEGKELSGSIDEQVNAE